MKRYIHLVTFSVMLAALTSCATRLHTLHASLGSPEATVRRDAAWQLGEMQNPKSLQPLGSALRAEHNPETQEFMIMAIASILEIPNDISVEDAIRATESNTSLHSRIARRNPE